MTHDLVLPCGTDNAICHTRYLTRDKIVYFEKKIKKKWTRDTLLTSLDFFFERDVIDTLSKSWNGIETFLKV